MKYDNWTLGKIRYYAQQIVTELDKKVTGFEEAVFISACEDLIKFYLEISERKVVDVLKDD